jgi:uncharacterized protein (DUF433 family)
MKSKYIVENPLLMGGTPCFVGSRVPAKSLFVCLEAGYSLSHYLEQFPTLTREVAMHVLTKSRLVFLAAYELSATLRILLDE